MGTHRDLLDADFGVVALGFEFEFEVEGQDFRVDELFRLLFEPGVRKGLFERDAADEERLFHAASGHFFDPDQGGVERSRVEGLDGVDDHGREEGLGRVDQLGRHGGRGALEQQRPEVSARAGTGSASSFESLRRGTPLFVGGVDGDCELVDALDGESGGGAVALDDDVRADAVLDKLLCLAEEFGREQHDRGGSVSDFGVLGAGDIDQGLGGGVDDVEQAEDGRAVVRDGRVAVGADDELVHAARAEGRGDGGGDAQARGNVAQELRRPLARVGALAQDEHRRVLHSIWGQSLLSPRLGAGSACDLLPSWECGRSSCACACLSVESSERSNRRRRNFGRGRWRWSKIISAFEGWHIEGETSLQYCYDIVQGRARSIAAQICQISHSAQAAPLPLPFPPILPFAPLCRQMFRVQHDARRSLAACSRCLRVVEPQPCAAYSLAASAAIEAVLIAWASESQDKGHTGEIVQTRSVRENKYPEQGGTRS